MILDFVLDHLEHEYLETEAQKVEFFHRRLRIPMQVLPGRIYKGVASDSQTKRYFVDRFPILIPCGPISLLQPLAPTFVYCDSGEPGLLRFIGHLRAYENLLHHISSFNFVYAAPSEAKFKRAAKFFAHLFAYDALDPDRLIRYFEIRRLWEAHKTGSLTRTDRELLRQGDKHFHSQIFQQAYKQWSTTNLSQTYLNGVMRRARAHESRLFSTWVLPDDYDIFEQFSEHHSESQSGTISRNRSSRVGSSLALSPVPPKSLELQ